MQSAADQNANIIFGAVIDETVGDHIRVTVIATGFEGRPREEERQEPAYLPEAPEQQPAAVAPAEETPLRPVRETSFDVPPDVLEVPSFLRDD